MGSEYLALAAAALRATKLAVDAVKPRGAVATGLGGPLGRGGGDVGAAKVAGEASAGLDAALESLGPRKKVRGSWVV